MPPRWYGRPFGWPMFAGPVVTRTRLGPMCLPAQDPGLRQLVVYGDLPHERAEAALLRALLPRMRTFVDVGANVGWYSRLAERFLPPSGIVVAIEANPALLGCLQANTRRAHLLTAAASDAAGTVALHVAASSDLSSTVRSVGPAVDVPAVRLDDVCAARNLVPDVVKCDVEGAEPAVLRGAGTIRRTGRPPIWLVEVDRRFLRAAGTGPDAFAAELGAGGPVRLYVAEGGRWLPIGGLGRIRHANVLVVPAARAAEVADLVG